MPNIGGCVFPSPPFPCFSLPALSPAPPRYDHVVIVIEENESLETIRNNPNAPYLNSLAASGVSFVNMLAITHPSQPNYLEFFAGTNAGVLNNQLPAANGLTVPFTAPNLGAALRSAGFSFIGYSEDLPAAGDNTTIGLANSNGQETYVRRHNPWANWQSSADPLPANSLPPEVNQPFSAFPTDFTQLPTVAIVIPNNENNMHNSGATVAEGDAWIQEHLGAYAEWATTHNSLLIVTWDEDRYANANQIPTIFHGPGLKPGVNTGAWSLHNLLRTIGDIYSLPPIGRAAKVQPITDLFAGETTVGTRIFQQDAGYSSAKQVTLRADQPDTVPDTNLLTVSADDNAAEGLQPAQTLIRFDDLFGNGGGQFPKNAPIRSAKLRLLTANSGNSTARTNVFLHRMRIPWNMNSTWNSLRDGVRANDREASRVATFSAVPNQPAADVTFDVTQTLRVWAAGGRNHGWLLQQSGTAPWRFLGPLQTTQSCLFVTFEGSQIGFTQSAVTVAEGDGNAVVSVQRRGWAGAKATVNYETSAGTATAGDDFTATSGRLIWAAGDMSNRTVTVPITSDLATESSEMFKIKLLEPGGAAILTEADSATVTVTD